ncbi:sugar MFS transporter [Pedobacter sp. Hv1]|uniref:sugar MFS transporter n=1 Tax=Pedobacter sp. Hv1 TaxID=1740090 RepID=UPI0006D8C544|nr:sugar MFS transporter [Pedobacter sp. Hv1]KQC00884.1 MFS transporter [Pedobacter sp. Hv1]
MTNVSLPLKEKNYTAQVITIGGFFFIFGFLTWVNGTLIPYLKIACELEEWQAYLVVFAFYISYTVMALPSGKFLERTGMVSGMRIGLLIMAFGCLLFVPAALTRMFPLFLLGLFIVGTGLTLLQTAVNPYITLLGPPERAAQRISIMGICNKFAGVIAPIILGAILLHQSDLLISELKGLSGLAKQERLDELARGVILPYMVLTAILILIAWLLKYPKLPPLQAESSKEDDHKKSLTSQQVKSFSLGFLAIFCTVGVEVIAGDTIGNYGLYHNLSLDIAKSLTSYTLAAMMTGYIIGVVIIPKYVSQEKAFLLSNLLAMVLTMVILFSPSTTSIAAVALLGFANALLWPAIWPKALKTLTGKQLNKASAILIMGIAGGALLPLLYGWISHSFNNQIAYLVLIPCYLFNIYYFFYQPSNSKT